MLELYLALVLFAFVSSVTPGPNNIMLLASGANVGYDKTIPNTSASLFKIKLIIKLDVFLISISMNQFIHFVSSNFCC